MKQNILFSLVILPLLFLQGCTNQNMMTTPVTKNPPALSGSVLTTPTPEVTIKDSDTYVMTLSQVTHAVAGNLVPMFAYNGTIPGPVLRVPQGAKITMKIKNDIAESTMLHPHGLRTSNASDGSHLVQHEVMPGETFTQILDFPDAGAYWYHPHMSEVAQQELGLYGMFIVEPKDTKEWPKVNRELPFIVDDILLGQNGQPYFGKTTDRTLMGRFGNVMLVNGDDHWQMDGQKGEVTRLYLLNAANTRPFRLAIPGAKIKRIGGDNGLYEKETFEDTLILGPSERTIVDVYFPEAKDYVVQNVTTTTTTLGVFHIKDTKLSFDYKADFDGLRTHEKVTKEIAELMAKKPLEKSLTLSLDMKGMGMDMNHGGGGMMACHTMPDGTSMGNCESTDPMLKGIEWEDTMSMMNSMSTKDTVQWKFIDPATNLVNDAIHWVFKKGDAVKITIFNDPNSAHPMQHPVHLHGNRFVVLTRDGKPETNRVWKDTVLVKTGEKVEILLDTSNPGKWMGHCHISEHLDDGMMFLYDVE